MNKSIFIWSEGWCIENGKAWFVDGKRDTLYCLDFNTEICEYITKLPNNNPSRFRLNLNCIKIGDDIFCMPDMGECIWVYNVVNLEFRQIVIQNPNNVRLFCTGTWQCGNRLFTLSGGLKQIIEIDIKKKVVDGYYTITNLPDENLSRSIRVGMSVYLLSSLPNKIYQFDLESKKVSTHILPGIERRLFTICFDGTKFWLSGYKKEVYVWDKEKNHIETLTDFPEGFGEYDFSGKEEPILNSEKSEYKFPTFIDSKTAGGTIWFIPFQTNKIIYVDSRTYEMQSFEMPGEVETRESLMTNDMAAKYLNQYVLNDRYLGIFSFKNHWIIEIDTKSFQSKEITASFDFSKYENEPCENVFEEYCLKDIREFRFLLMARKKDERICENMMIGEKIYMQA